MTRPAADPSRTALDSLSIAHGVHWTFFINIPIGVATAVLANRLLDRDKGIGFGDGADVPGAVLITTSLMLGVYTIVKPAADDGWGSAQTLGLGATSLLLLVAFVVREARAATRLCRFGSSARATSPEPTRSRRSAS